MRLLDSGRTTTGKRVPPSIRLEDLLTATGGQLIGPTIITEFTGAAVDSRHVTPGCCFVALRGERVDGHAFVDEAVRNGAHVVLVERPVSVSRPAAVVQVSDGLLALQELASWWRSLSSARVVGITGSTGKTIAKEITADVLGRCLDVLRSEGNLNSETGLPMTLLRLEPRHQAAVLEMSMYTTGEIARLAEIAVPEIGVVLAVHPTHLQRAGSIEAIARAKAELPAALPRQGLAVLNADDRRVAAMDRQTAARVITFGLGDAADVRATEIESLGIHGTTFVMNAPWGTRRIVSGTPGRHLVPHALAAAAVGQHFEVPLDEVAAALEQGSHAEHRMAIGESAGGATIVDDTYNASPVSVAAALDFLGETPVQLGRRRLAILGDMLELGPDEERLHREIGTKAAHLVDGLLAVGERGRWIADAARSEGLANIAIADDASDALDQLQRTLAPGPGDLLLVKASRGIGLETVVEALEAGSC